MIRFIPTNGAYGTLIWWKDLCDIFNVHGEQYVIDYCKKVLIILKHTIDTNYEKSFPSTPSISILKEEGSIPQYLLCFLKTTNMIK
jgi:hypothetical protein